MRHQFEPALGAFQRFERMHGQRFLAAGRDDQPRRDQRIGGLEIAGQRQIDLMPAASAPRASSRWPKPSRRWSTSLQMPRPSRPTVKTLEPVRRGARRHILGACG